MIVAMGHQGQIGQNNQLLWSIPEDLKRFKKLTMGHHILMGRKTFESIGRALPGRPNIVITRNPTWHHPGIQTAQSLSEALDLAKNAGEAEAFVIGGGEIYKQALPQTSQIHLSLVDYHGEADTFFPIPELDRWQEEQVEHHDASEKTLAWTYKKLTRQL